MAMVPWAASGTLTSKMAIMRLHAGWFTLPPLVRRETRWIVPSHSMRTVGPTSSRAT
jgi:hypothetical protein